MSTKNADKHLEWQNTMKILFLQMMSGILNHYIRLGHQMKLRTYTLSQFFPSTSVSYQLITKYNFWVSGTYADIGKWWGGVLLYQKIIEKSHISIEAGWCFRLYIIPEEGSRTVSSSFKSVLHTTTGTKGGFDLSPSYDTVAHPIALNAKELLASRSIGTGKV